MDKNLVVSLKEIKGIRLQCEECESEAVVIPTNPYGIESSCPQGHLWKEARLGSGEDYIYMFLCALQRLIESPAPFKAVRLEIDAKLAEGCDE